MDLMPGNLSRMICHRLDLPLPMLRGSKGPIWMKLSLQQLWRPCRIHTPLVSANAVIMWCMECIWISNRMRLLDRANVCSCFSLESSRLSGWQQVRAALYACIHRGPSGRCLVRIASMEACPDVTCAVRGAWVPWIPSAQATVFPCTIAAPRHRTLRYPTLTGPTVPCLPACLSAPTPCTSSSVCS